jgi:hypothetical protein
MLSSLWHFRWHNRASASLLLFITIVALCFAWIDDAVALLRS